MEILYATTHKWVKPVVSNPLTQFGSNSKSRLNATLAKASSCGIVTKIEPLNADFFDWFLPIYKARIEEKENPVIFDIQGKTLGNPRRAHRFYSLSLWENETPIGGTIFCVQKKKLSIAYRTYAYEWMGANLPATPSLYAEYQLCLHAHTLGKELITHGKHRNPYGIHSSIGLAMFKLSVGCTPQKSKRFEIKTLDTDALDTDTLVFEYPGEQSERITHASLITKEENLHKWTQLTKYPDQLQVTVIYR